MSLKVAINTRLLLPGRMEGIARFIHETSRRLVKLAPEIEFHFLFDRPFDQKYIYANNIIPIHLRPPARHPLLWKIWFEWSVRRYLERNKIDVFVSGDMYLSLKSKVPTLLVSHDLNYIHFPEGLKKIHLNYLNKNFPKFHRRADHIAAVSEFTKQDIIQQFGIADDKISVVYNDAPDGFQILGDEEKAQIRNCYTGGKEYFIYIGSVHPRKNIPSLLNAFELFKRESNSSIKLLLLGRWAFKTAMVSEIYEQMTFKHEVIIIDNPAVDAIKLLGAAMALCYVSKFEGFGIPILEAFHSGVPVICSDVSSMPEVAGDAAHLVDPKSVTDIKDGMMKVSADQVYRSDLIQKGHLQKSYFSWDNSAKQLLSIIKKLADNGNGFLTI